MKTLTSVTMKSSKICRVNIEGVRIQRFGHCLRLDQQGVYVMSVLAARYIYVHIGCSWLSQRGNSERSQMFSCLISVRNFTSMQQKYEPSCYFIFTVLGPYCRPLHKLAQSYRF